MVLRGQISPEQVCFRLLEKFWWQKMRERGQFVIEDVTKDLFGQCDADSKRRYPFRLVRFNPRRSFRGAPAAQ